MFKDYTKSLDHALCTLQQSQLDSLYGEIYSRINKSSKIHILGNGGSAANANHIVGDYIKTFSLLNIKLNICNHLDNICYLTAVSNDLDYSEAYSCLIGTLIEKNDLIIYLSGSGNSLNLVKCAKKASSYGIIQSSISAYNGGSLKEITDIPIHINYPDMEIAEDCQLIIFHYFKQRLVKDIGNSDQYMSDLMPKYSKRVVEDLIA